MRRIHLLSRFGVCSRASNAAIGVKFYTALSAEWGIKMKKICIIGSINMDMVIETAYPPVMGETVHGSGFKTVPGGKGANQAVAAAKLGNEVSFIGAVGKDAFGAQMIDNLKNSGVNVSGIESFGTSGIAMIIVSGGDNTIILEGGANMALDNSLIDRHISLIEESDIVIFQLEIPSKTVLYAMKKAKELGKKVLLNPAPIATFDTEMLKYTDIFIPNQHEAGSILGMKIDDEALARGACREFIDMGVDQTIITLGSDGCVYNMGTDIFTQPAFKVKAVDSTAAGDSFIGAFCAGLDSRGIKDAVRYACAVSAVVVSRAGASSSIPSRDEVEEFLKEKSV